jgi:hypothetical protein
MKGGNTDSNAKAGELPGLERGDYAKFDMTGGKKKGKGKAKKSSSKFSDFDFEKEWKEFETSYNQKYGGAKKRKTSSTKKKPTKKASSTKKPTKKASSAKKPKRKTQRGGDDPAATSAPANFFDANATMSSPSSDQSKGSLMNGLYPHAPNNPVVDQTGGAKKKKASKAKKSKTATKTTKPKKDTKKKDSKKDAKKDSKKDTKSTSKKVSVLDKIKKFFAM